MPREEQISVKLVKDQASFDAMKAEAKALQSLFGSIKIGNIAQAEKQQAAAAKEAANATLAQAKANKELQNAEIAKQKAIQAGIETDNKRIKQQKEAANAEAAVQNAAKKGLQTRSAALRLAVQESAVIEKQARVYKQLGESLGKVNTDHAKSLQTMTNYIRGLQGMENASVKATGVVRNAAGTFQTYQASVNNADGTTQRFRFSVNTAEGDVYKLDQGLRMTAGGANMFGSAITNAGKQMLNTMKTMVGFYGVAQSLRYAFREMKSMSDEMIVYQKVTKATAAEMEKLRAASYASAKQYGQTPTDFLSAAQEMARAGYKDRSAAMADLATKTKLVGDITADEASKFLLAVDAGYKYGGSIEKLSSVLDMANEVGNNYATSVGKISEGMTLVASLASQANVPVEQLIAALGTMTAATQRSGSEMARALRFIMLGVMGDTVTEVEEGVTVTAEEVDSLTTALQHYAPEVVKAAKETGKIINPMEAVASLAKAYKNGLIGSQEELFKISKALAGQRYYNAFAALIENWDTMYQGMLEVERNAAGSADAEIAVLTNSWTTKLNRLKTAWTEMVNKTISEGFVKDLISGATEAMKFAGSLENLGLMAGSAYMAIKTLSAGIQRYQKLNRMAALTGAPKVGFGAGVGAFNWAMLGVSAAVGIVSAIKAAQEAAARAAVEAAQKQIATTEKEIDKYKQIANISAQYKKIYSDGIVNEEEKTELVTMQEELNRLLGDQAKAIDLVNGKYDDMQKAIDKAVESQGELTQAEVNRAANAMFLAFGKNIGNGITAKLIGDSVLPATLTGFGRYFTTPSSFAPGSSLYDIRGKFNKPDSISGIIDFYKFIDESLKQLDAIAGFAEDHRKDYEFIYNLKNQMDEIGVPDVIQMMESMERMSKATKEGTAATEDETNAANAAAGAMNKEAKAANELAQSIHNATTAKEKFDKAMQSTKADAMSGYAEAYKTLEEEIKSGRVNSTAFYASARMLLGDEAFAATGGVSANVLAALQSGGASGTLSDAMKILNTQYQDKEGNIIQGAGILQLLAQTKGLSAANFMNADGTYRYKLTDAEIQTVSKEWGNLSVDFIKATLNALDQYDINGAATEDVKDALGVDATEANTTAIEASTAATVEAKDAINALNETLGGNPSGQGTANSENNAGGSKPFERMIALAGHAELTDAVLMARMKVRAEEHAKEIESQYQETLADKAPSWAEVVAAQRTQHSDNDKDGKGGSAFEIGQGGNIPGDSLFTHGGGRTAFMPFSDVNAVREHAASKPEDKLARIFGFTNDQEIVDAYNKVLAQVESNKKKGAPGSHALQAAMSYFGLTADDMTRLSAMSWDAQQRLKIAAEPELAPDAAQEMQEQLDNVNLHVETVPDIVEIGPAGDDDERDVTLDVGANTDKAESEIENLVDSVPKTVYIEVKTKGTHLTKPSGGGMFSAILDALTPAFHAYDSGTPYHPGGLAMVNDGNGPELILSNGRAFIAGGGNPSLVNLERGAKVFTAGETSRLLHGGSVPAYDEGTSGGNLAEWASAFAAWLNIPGLKPVPEEDTKSKSSGSGNSGPKVDKESFAKLQNLINYILDRINTALEEQTKIIDNQIDALQKERELSEQQNKLEELQKNLSDALNERTVRYLGEDGKWHWMADANKVQKAQEELQKYQDEMTFNARIEALENQKKELQDEYAEITKAWTDIQEAVDTPTGDLNALLANVLKNGTAPQKKAAQYIQSLLIGNLLQGGSYSGNYDEALQAIGAANKGSPYMPTELSYTLASLIAHSGGGGNAVGDVTDALMQTSGGILTSGNAGNVYGGSNTTYNYFINGIELGSDQANRPLSDVIRDLGVYANSVVH